VQEAQLEAFFEGDNGMRTSGTFLTAVIAVSAVAVLLAQVLAQPAGGPPAKPPPSRVAVCDVIKVFNNYERGLSLSKEFDQRTEQIKAEDDRRGKEIQNLVERLEALKPGSKEYETQYQEMQKLAIQRRVWFEMQQQSIGREHVRLTEQMYRETLDAVAKVAEERGFDVVLNREGVSITSRSTTELLNKIALRKCLYAKDSSDLTQLVLDRINRQYREGRK
jgi:Skp family chaperone for outer membrane proteins